VLQVAFAVLFVVVFFSTKQFSSGTYKSVLCELTITVTTTTTTTTTSVFV